jgi:hypothetical protein
MDTARLSPQGRRARHEPGGARPESQLERGAFSAEWQTREVFELGVCPSKPVGVTLDAQQ